ncbi:MobA/MobL family protein, partial [Escherichia coli]|uniref:MobA/MobL family protein n=1 Tax=Escherichia coli TaxID=562 RepID=UPI003EE07B43
MLHLPAFSQFPQLLFLLSESQASGILFRTSPLGIPGVIAPEWARDNPSHFWQAADQFERANGSTYRELEIALPRELTPEQR